MHYNSENAHKSSGRHSQFGAATSATFLTLYCNLGPVWHGSSGGARAVLEEPLRLLCFLLKNGSFKKTFGRASLEEPEPEPEPEPERSHAKQVLRLMPLRVCVVRVVLSFYVVFYLLSNKFTGNSLAGFLRKMNFFEKICGSDPPTYNLNNC